MAERNTLWRSEWVWHERISEWVWMSGRSIKRLKERNRQQEREEEAGQENPLPHTMGIPVHFNFKFGFKIKGSILFPNSVYLEGSYTVTERAGTVGRPAGFPRLPPSGSPGPCIPPAWLSPAQLAQLSSAKPS